jgi:hypothetical protein
VVSELHHDKGLREVLLFGQTQLEQLKNDELSTVPGTREFRLHAVEERNGVHFTCGLQYRASFVAVGDHFDSIQGAVRFLPSAAGADGSVGSGGISAAMDEVLAHVSMATNCGGFTASLTVEQTCDEITGSRIQVPCEETLRYEGFLEHSCATSKGGAKSHVRGVLLSADRSIVYARATGLFVRPALQPSPRQIEALFAQGANMRADLALIKAAEDVEALAEAEQRRTHALDTLRVAPGSPLLLSHVENFDYKRAQWLETDEVAMSLKTSRDLGALELEGKVFSAFPIMTTGFVRGAIKFAYSSQGPPSTAHGGSRFAVFERAALVACQDLRPSHDVQLLQTEVQMKARLPLNTTVWLELSVEASGASNNREELKATGRLVSVDGKTVFDVAEAWLLASQPCPTDVIEHRLTTGMMPVALASKL